MQQLTLEEYSSQFNSTVCRKSQAFGDDMRKRE